jgi:putative hydrolase of the HAD superfamily
MSASAPNVRSAPPVERLILDIGGVILPSAMPQVIAELSAHSGRSDQQLWRFFNTRLFQPFWSGRMDLDEFWQVFTAYAQVPAEPAAWQTQMTASMLRPFDHLAVIRRWASVVPVGVLSNHRAEWVLPVFARYGLIEVLNPLLISSLTGLVKPDPRAFAQLSRLGTLPKRVLYVDDRPQALRRAEHEGIATLEARDAPTWIDQVSARLGLHPASPGS